MSIQNTLCIVIVAEWYFCPCRTSSIVAYLGDPSVFRPVDSTAQPSLLPMTSRTGWQLLKSSQHWIQGKIQRQISFNVYGACFFRSLCRRFLTTERMSYQHLQSNTSFARIRDNDVVVCSLNFTSTRYIRLSYSTPISRRRTGLCLDTVFLSQFWHWMLSFLYLKSLFWQESNLHLFKAPKWGVGLDPQMCFKFMFEIRVQVCITLSPWLWGADMVNMTDTINNSIVYTTQGEEAGKIVKFTEFHWFECYFRFNSMI